MTADIGTQNRGSTTTRGPVDLVRQAAAPIVAGLMLLVSLVGPGWLYVPANPAAHMPEVTLTFNDLHDLARSGLAPTNSIQQAYFGWLGWALALTTVAVALAAALLRRRLLAMAAGALAVAGLVCTAFGVKGVLSWSQLMDQTENVRPGVYLVVAGYLIALGSAAVLTRRRA
jgi:hypothetical protein